MFCFLNLKFTFLGVGVPRDGEAILSYLLDYGPSESAISLLPVGALHSQGDFRRRTPAEFSQCQPVRRVCLTLRRYGGEGEKGRKKVFIGFSVATSSCVSIRINAAHGLMFLDRTGSGIESKNLL